jgi:cell division initiation protein
MTTDEFRRVSPMADLDLPLLPSAEQIRRRQFATVRRGYDPDQVQEYLNQVATQVEALEKELREQRLQVGARADAPPAPAPPAEAAAVAAAPSADAYQQLSARLATVLRAADEQAQQLVADARAEAKKVLDEAQADADKVKVDAQASAEEARTKSAEELARAREEADRILGGLEQRRETMLQQMHEMQSRLLAVAQNLDVPDVDDGATSGAHVASSGASRGSTPPNEPEAERQSAPPSTPEPPSAPAEPSAPAIGSAATTGNDAVDPRYEDMWGAGQSRPASSVDLPDLSSIDIDFDDEERS